MQAFGSCAFPRRLLLGSSRNKGPELLLRRETIRYYSLAEIRAGLASSNPRRWSRDGLPGPSSKTTRKPAM
jgi:hypothetical protein